MIHTKVNIKINMRICVVVFTQGFMNDAVILIIKATKFQAFNWTSPSRVCVHSKSLLFIAV